MLTLLNDNVLSGSNVNDDDDVSATIGSLNAAEKTLGKTMAAPEVNVKFYLTHGNKVENLLADNDRIYGKFLDEALEDAPP